MFGLGGDFTDPNAIEFANRVRDKLGVDIGESPYQYWQTDLIVSAIDAAPKGTTIFVWGTSLGANNVQVVCTQTARIIAGAFLFQASQFGARNTIPMNVEFFHEFYNPFIALGSYKPQLAEGNHVTVPIWSERWVNHPGDQDKYSQDVFLDDMARILGK